MSTKAITRSKEIIITMSKEIIIIMSKAIITFTMNEEAISIMMMT